MEEFTGLFAGIFMIIFLTIVYHVIIKKTIRKKYIYRPDPIQERRVDPLYQEIKDWRNRYRN